MHSPNPDRFKTLLISFYSDETLLQEEALASFADDLQAKIAQRFTSNEENNFDDLSSLPKLAIATMIQKIEAIPIEEGADSTNAYLAFTETFREAISHSTHDANIRYVEELAYLQNLSNFSIEDLRASKARVIELYRKFMAKQEVYADAQYEGAALAEALGIHLTVRSVNPATNVSYDQDFGPSGEGIPIIILEHTQGELGAHYVVHQVNENIIPHSIAGTGNCLFDSFAQAIIELYIQSANLETEASLGRRRTLQYERGIALDLIAVTDAPAHVTRLKLGKTLFQANAILQLAQRLFNPPTDVTASFEVETEAEDVQKAIMLARGENPLARKASALLEGSKHSDARMTSMEHRTVKELALRAGGAIRPQYFKPLEEEGATEDPEIHFAIGAQFLKGFIEENALAGWMRYILALIESNTELTPEAKTAAATFLKGLEFLLNYVSSDASRNPSTDLLNKYVTPEKIRRANIIRNLLNASPDHKDHVLWQRELRELNHEIQESRSRVMKEGFEWMMTLFKGMMPEYEGLTEEAILAQQKEQSRQREKETFSRYVLEEWPKVDPFEPNQIRAFWEQLQRNQHGKPCYQILCESFEPAYQDSMVHQRVQQIWAVSLLDTIHQQPKEAKSRMPASSTDGEYAPNFGYAMARSESYKEWISNPLVRAAGDIIMDQFHLYVRFGCELDIDRFIERFQIHFLEDKPEGYYQEVHPYDALMLTFDLYLLDKVYKKPFEIGEEKTIPDELQKEAQTPEALLFRARQALEAFKLFAENMAALKPSDEALSREDMLRGIVFGIGYNGELFNSPVRRHQSQIWLTFSNSGRNEGGYLLLSFMAAAAQRPDKKILISPEQIRVNFARYKAMIKLHINRDIKYAYDFLDDLSCPRSYATQVRAKLAQKEGFLAELEQDIAFDYLSPSLKRWIRETSNWYYIPADNYIDDLGVEIKIPEEMPKAEHTTQYLARDLLFDALASRSFSEERPNLLPLLFLHWKREIVALFKDPKLKAQIGAVKDFAALTADLQSIIKKQIDQLVIRVHKELVDLWKPGLDKHFSKFMKKSVDTLESKINALTQTLKKLAKQKSVPEVQKLIEAKTAELENLQAEKARLPKNPSELSKEEYERFRREFFEDRDVTQCIEPVFARVLGHDHFFSIFISKKVNATNIIDATSPAHRPLQLGHITPQDAIAPCDKRCQHHVLGHLYTGDILAPQSADRLDQTRKAHGLGSVPERLMSLPLLAQHLRREGSADVAAAEAVADI